MDIFQALFGGLLWVPKSKKVSVFSLSQNCLGVLAWKSKASVKKLCKFKSKLNEKLTMNNEICCQIMCWVYSKGCGWSKKWALAKNKWSPGPCIYVATKHDHAMALTKVPGRDTKNSKLSGGQNFMRKNFPDGVRKLFLRHIYAKSA